ncbi:hypothetical protein [uncultured Tenacibaculum sp.]|uniref:hypothetical protein n=1 Tax=uncultured Tenacibaculum sp. TaxID=174713 RepID=UPI002623F196|nr:hypothetical protein [uncultured Tenacibaculum sp.]
MAHSLEIEGNTINFTATTSILEGKNNDADVSGYSFQEANEDGNTSTHQYEVITSTATSLQIQINLTKGDTLNVWTNLLKDGSDLGGEDPTTPRGTEVVVKGDDM